MPKFKFLDEDWDDLTPMTIEAENVPDAVRKFYTEELIVPVPKFSWEEAPSAKEGSATFGAIGRVRAPSYIVTDENGADFWIFLEGSSSSDED